jgi:hypothetical protein
MSRWQTEFEQHQFQANWLALQNEADGLFADDPSVLTVVQEVARLKKVIVYLREAIASVDVELVPSGVWDNFHGQCSPCLQEITNYNSNRGVNHLQNANRHLDNLLSYVRPYLILPESVMQVLGASARTYREQMEQAVTSFQTQVSTAVKEVSTNQVLSTNLVESARQSKAQIDLFVTDLIEGSEEKESIKTAVESAKSLVDKNVAEVNEFHKVMLIDQPENESIKTKVEQAAGLAVTQKNTIDNLLKLTQKNVNDLHDYHQMIFGFVTPQGQPVQGLKQELDNRLDQLDRLEEAQKIKNQALYEEIEKLLPGATSAGLANAYEVQRRYFYSPIKNNTKLFYVSVCLIPLVAFLTSIENFTVSPFSIYITRPENFDEIMKAMLIKLPFLAPLVWLALFASTRRSQYERLRQEYAHKAALAKSYHGYKKQLEALQGSDVEPLQKELIAKAIEAIAYNASKTLDGNHREKMPMEHALDVLTSEKGQSVFDRLLSLLNLRKGH